MWGVLYSTVPSSFANLEKQQLQFDISRFNRALFVEFQKMDESAQSYAAWDLPSNLIAAPSLDEEQVANFLASDYSDTSMASTTNLTLHYFLNGSLAFGKAYGGAPIPRELLQLSSSHPIMAAGQSLSASVSGFLTIDGDGGTLASSGVQGTHNVYLVVARALKFSNFSGPIVGVLAWARTLLITDLYELAQNAQTCASLGVVGELSSLPNFEQDMVDFENYVLSNGPFSDVTIKSEFSQWREVTERPVVLTASSKAPRDFQKRVCWKGDHNSAKTEEVGHLASEETTDRLATFFVVENLFGHPLVLVRLDRGRDVYLLGRSTVELVYVMIAAIDLVFGTGIVLFIELIVLRPISKLTASLREITMSSDVTQRVIDFTSRDELGFLAAAVNKMLESIRQVLRQLEIEKAKSDKLLYNMIPIAIVNRLKAGEKTIADSFQCATCMFVDIVGFTPMSATMSPSALVKMLNIIFTEIDSLVERHHVEKIKSIGDAVMLVSGVPNLSKTHAQDMVDLALSIFESVEHINHKHNLNIKIRAGMSSGPVTAGVIGRTKFMYDLWGNTVNEASRMESYGLPDSIHMTEATAKLVMERYPVEYRGKMMIKGKGEMKTWLLHRRNAWNHRRPGTCPNTCKHRQPDDASAGATATVLPLNSRTMPCCNHAVPSLVNLHPNRPDGGAACVLRASSFVSLRSFADFADGRTRSVHDGTMTPATNRSTTDLMASTSASTRRLIWADFPNSAHSSSTPAHPHLQHAAATSAAEQPPNENAPAAAAAAALVLGRSVPNSREESQSGTRSWRRSQNRASAYLHSGSGGKGGTDQDTDAGRQRSNSRASRTRPLSTPLPLNMPTVSPTDSDADRDALPAPHNSVLRDIGALQERPPVNESHVSVSGKRLLGLGLGLGESLSSVHSLQSAPSTSRVPSRKATSRSSLSASNSRHMSPYASAPNSPSSSHGAIATNSLFSLPELTDTTPMDLTHLTTSAFPTDDTPSDDTQAALPAQVPQHLWDDDAQDMEQRVPCTSASVPVLNHMRLSTRSGVSLTLSPEPDLEP